MENNTTTTTNSSSFTTLTTTSPLMVSNFSGPPPLESYREDPAALFLGLFRVTFLMVNAAVALVGNSLSLAVFTRSRHLRREPSSGYLAALAVADTGSAVTAALGIALSMYGSLSTILFCNIVHFLSFVFQFLAVWLVCFTAERYVSVCHALRAAAILNRFRGHREIVLLVVLPCVIYMPHLVVPKRLEFSQYLRTWECRWVDESFRVNYEVPFLYVTFALHFVVPMAIIAVLNVLIIRQLCRSSRIAEMGAQADSERDAENRHITLMLLLVCLVFFLCHFPFNLVYLLNMLKIRVDRWLYQVAQTIFKLSYSTNFFLYTLSGSHFRSSVKALFKSREDMESSELGNF